jgi:hypothetical protein
MTTAGKGRGASLRRIAAAGVLASGVGAVAAWAGYLVVVAASVGLSEAAAGAPALLWFFLVIAWPIALVATLIAGAVLHHLLRRQGLLARMPVTLAASAVGAVLFPLAWRELVSLLGDLPGLWVAILIGALSGLAAGWTFWTIVSGADGPDFPEPLHSRS